MRQFHLFRSSIGDAFRVFHAENPHVYAELRAGALRLHHAGWKHFGIARLYEGLRYQRALETTAKDWKLDNNFRALYARLLMEQEPELEGFFELRQRTAA